MLLLPIATDERTSIKRCERDLPPGSKSRSFLSARGPRPCSWHDTARAALRRDHVTTGHRASHREILTGRPPRLNLRRSVGASRPLDVIRSCWGGPRQDRPTDGYDGPRPPGRPVGQGCNYEESLRAIVIEPAAAAWISTTTTTTTKRWKRRLATSDTKAVSVSTGHEMQIARQDQIMLIAVR